MKVHLTTLSNHLYEASRERLCDSARKSGIFNIHSFDFEEIRSTAFYSDNEEILSNVRFLGYWLWKSYIIADVLAKADEGDVVIYADAGTEIISDLSWLINHCKKNEPIIVFGNAMDNNATWTKRDCFVIMDCDKPEFWFGPHCDASFMLFRKCQASVDFVNEWLRYGQNKNIITEIPNICGLPNIEGFRDHRYDQSILSLLSQKNRLNLYRIPSQFGNHYKMNQFRVENEFNCENQWSQVQVSFYNCIPYYNSFYGQLLNHHRTKKIIPSVEQPATPKRGFLHRIRKKLINILKG